jgi:uncharacterized membrane protein YkoI
VTIHIDGTNDEQEIDVDAVSGEVLNSRSDSDSDDDDDDD